MMSSDDMLSADQIDKPLSEEIDDDTPPVVAEEAIRIGVDGYCRATDVVVAGRDNVDVCAAIRRAYDTVNVDLGAAGYSIPAQTDVPAWRCLKNINAQLARADLTGDDGDDVAAVDLLRRIAAGTLTELANVPRAEQKKKATKKGDG